MERVALIVLVNKLEAVPDTLEYGIEVLYNSNSCPSTCPGLTGSPTFNVILPEAVVNTNALV